MRAFPPQAKLITENTKSYIVFPNKTGGVMLADKLYHTTGEKAGQRIQLSSKLAKDFPQPGKDWYASEKFDGLRGLWTGQELVSRPTKEGDVLRGKVFTVVPDFFKKLLPPGIALDGEIWMGRGNFQKVAGLSNLKVTPKNTLENITEAWKDVKFMVFDCPSDPGNYEERMKNLKKILPPTGPVKLVTNYKIRDDDHLLKIYHDLIGKGAEGVMLRAPKSLYEPKRSKMLLKMKIQDDAEATVTGYLEGTGKYEGLLGSVKCVLPSNGKEFNVGTGFTDEIRANYNVPDSKYYIPIGSLVSFSYMELTQEGVPRHPAFRGVRTDVNIDYKEQIIEAFKAILTKLKADREPNYQFKMGTYNKAIKAFQKSTDTICSVHDALNQLRENGEKLTQENPQNPKSSVLKKVAEIIMKGSCQSAETAKTDPKTLAVETLTKIPHVGDAKAGSLWDNYKIKNPRELRNNSEAANTLTDSQKLGLEYFEDLSERIPRKEMNQWNKILQKTASGYLTGSYRRGKKESGDIDYLLCGGERVIETYLKKLESNKKISILGYFSKGDTQWQGVMKLKDGTARHVDLFCYPVEKFAYGLLHATGSYEFNIKCRKAALSKGMSLSQYGLDPEPPDINLLGGLSKEDDEKKILDYLGVGWVEPKDR